MNKTYASYIEHYIASEEKDLREIKTAIEKVNNISLRDALMLNESYTKENIKRAKEDLNEAIRAEDV